jgi:pimeloyl-ACP methyl ester carboxylesterase
MREIWPSIAALSIRAAKTGVVAVGGIGLAACLKLPPANAPTGPGEEASVGSEGVGKVLEPARSVGEVYAPGEVRAFMFRQGSEEIGVSYGRYDGPRTTKSGAVEHHFSARNTLRVPGRTEVRTEGHLVLDDAGQLLRGWEQSEAARLDYEVQGDTLILSAGDERESLAYAPGDGFMGFMSTMHEELLFALRPVRDQPWTLRVVNLSGGGATPWEARVASRDADVFTVRTSLGETVRISKGRIVAIEVPDDELSVQPIDGATFPAWSVQVAAPLRYTLPEGASFQRREVSLAGRAGEPTLVGEVLVPRDGGKGLPAVLFLSGSGMTDRYGFAGPPPVDFGSHEITDALAEAGFVVLRYDEPGHGQSEASPLSWVRQQEDARRALRTLMVQPEIDPGRMVVVGHGEGGWRGVILAKERPNEVIAVAMLGSPGRSYRDTFERNAEAVRKTLSPDERARAVTQHAQLMAAIERGVGVPAELVPQAQWLREILDVDPAALVRGTKASVLLTYGDKDLEVNVGEAVERINQAAVDAGTQVKVQRFKRLDHLFKVEESERSTPASYRQQRPVDGEFLQGLIRWLREHSEGRES